MKFIVGVDGLDVGCYFCGISAEEMSRKLEKIPLYLSRG